jgi:hypothetical protein
VFGGLDQLTLDILVNDVERFLATPIDVDTLAMVWGQVVPDSTWPNLTNEEIDMLADRHHYNEWPGSRAHYALSAAEELALDKSKLGKRFLEGDDNGDIWLRLRGRTITMAFMVDSIKAAIKDDVLYEHDYERWLAEGRAIEESIREQEDGPECQPEDNPDPSDSA